MRDALRRVPVWAWLGAIVAGSVLLRLWLVRGLPAPFVFVDELIYSELARSLAAGDGYAVRDVATSGYSLLYPLLVAPAYAIDGLVTAHATAQSINAVVMSLAALPAYALARRVASPALALLVALGAVVLPSLAYTGTITTESLFYPVTLVLALALVRWLETPSWGRLGVLVALLAIAFGVRAQALGFAPALVTAPLVLALLRGSTVGLRRYASLAVVLAAAAVVVVVGQTVRGGSLADLLGAYSVVGESGYDVGQALRFWGWHLEELLLYVALVPAVAAVVLLVRGRRMPPRVQEHLAATVSLAVWSTLVVGTFASRFASDRVQDRYLFFLVPLLLVCLVAWVELGAPRPRGVVLPAAGLLLAAVLLFPYDRFIGEPAKSDTLGLIPLWAFNEHLVGGEYWLTVAVGTGALLALFLLVPARLAVLVPIAVVAAYAVLSRPVWASEQGFRAASVGALFQGIRGVERDWIDAAVPDGDEVVALWTGSADRFTINQNEFFNRRLGRVFYTEQPTPGGLAETRVLQGADGIFRDEEGRPVEAPYALLDQAVVPVGDVVARDDLLGTTLWRLRAPLQQTTTIEGIYPGETWSGRTVTWSRRSCQPGTLRAELSSDANLFDRPQTVTAATRAAGRTTRAVARFSPDETASLVVRVAPEGNGTCVVRYTVSPVANPAETVPGSTDDRVLGAHFVLSYTPDS